MLQGSAGGSRGKMKGGAGVNWGKRQGSAVGSWDMMPCGAEGRQGKVLEGVNTRDSLGMNIQPVLDEDQNQCEMEVRVEGWEEVQAWRIQVGDEHSGEQDEGAYCQQQHHCVVACKQEPGGPHLGTVLIDHLLIDDLGSVPQERVQQHQGSEHPWRA